MLVSPNVPDLDAQVTELKEVTCELISMYYSMACESIQSLEHDRIIAKAERLLRQV